MGRLENRKPTCDMGLKKAEKTVEKEGEKGIEKVVEKGFTITDDIIHTAVEDLLKICKICKYGYCKTKTAIFLILRELPENKQYKELH